MKVTSTFLPPAPQPPMVTLTITMNEEEARDFCEVAYSRMPARYGNSFITALNQIGIYRCDSPERIF